LTSLHDLIMTIFPAHLAFLTLWDLDRPLSRT
jgi:hypothetical protein